MKVESPIKMIRCRHALSRMELAHLAGVSYQSIYRTEAGLVQRPYDKIVQALAVLGHDPNAIRREHAEFIRYLAQQAMAKARGTGDGLPRA